MADGFSSCDVGPFTLLLSSLTITSAPSSEVLSPSFGCNFEGWSTTISFDGVWSLVTRDSLEIQPVLSVSVDPFARDVFRACATRDALEHSEDSPCSASVHRRLEFSVPDDSLSTFREIWDTSDDGIRTEADARLPMDGGVGTFLVLHFELILLLDFSMEEVETNDGGTRARVDVRPSDWCRTELRRETGAEIDFGPNRCFCLSDPTCRRTLELEGARNEKPTFSVIRCRPT